MRNNSDENMTVKKEENDQFRDNKTKNLKFRVTEEEYEYIQKKYELSGCKNISSYLRKMAVTGRIIQLDSSALIEISRLFSNIANNINQIAVRVNSTNRIYDEDIEEIQKKVKELWQLQTSIQSVLQSI